MPMRRVGRPGLIGTMARTAVVAGTANAVVGGMNSRKAGKAQAAAEQDAAAQQAAAESQAQMAEMQSQLDAVKAQQTPEQPAPATAPASAGGSDLMGQLQQLAQMKDAGILDDAEFAAAKAKLLA